MKGNMLGELAHRRNLALGVAGASLALSGLATTDVETARGSHDGVAVVIADWERSADAAAFMQFLVDVGQFSPANVVDLADPTPVELLKVFGNGGEHKGRLQEFVSGASGEERRVVVYYAGQRTPSAHERTTRTSPEMRLPAYVRDVWLGGRLLAPPETGLPDAGQAHPLDRLYKSIDALPVKSVTVFVDACPSVDESGEIAATEPQLGPPPADLPGAADGTITAIVAACGSTLTKWRAGIWQPRGQPVGPFAYHLLTGLYGAADDDRSGSVTADEVRRYLDLRLALDVGGAYKDPPAALLSGNGSAILAPQTVRDPEQVLDTILPSWPRPGLQPLVVSTSPESAQVQVVAAEPITRTVGARLWLLATDQDYGNGYHNGMALPPGEYRIEVSSAGYETIEGTVHHGWDPTERHVVLRQINRVWTHAGTRFRDCEHCPSMAVFEDNETMRDAAIKRPFALSVDQVTTAQWGACVSGVAVADICLRDIGTGPPLSN